MKAAVEKLRQMADDVERKAGGTLQDAVEHEEVAARLRAEVSDARDLARQYREAADKLEGDS